MTGSTHSHSATWSRRAIGAMPAGLLVVDPEGIVLFGNPGAARILRRSVETLRATNVAELLGPLETLRAQEHDGRGQCVLAVSPEKTIIVGFSLSDMEVGEDRAAHHVVLFQDITDVIALREERDRLMQLAAVGSILPTLLHELRNPIAAVSASLEVLVEDVADRDLQEQLHAVLVEIRRLQLGLQGIGTVGRDLGSSDYAAIDHALRETCIMMQPTAREAGVELVCSCYPMPLLPLDSAVIRGLLFNLLNNALAATRGGGRIDVAAGLLTSGDLRISVTDTGKGMSPHDLARCTELFYTTKPRGSGIGLALCRTTVEAAGGRIEIESEHGRGTQVTLVIPVGPQRGTDVAPDVPISEGAR